MEIQEDPGLAIGVWPEAGSVVVKLILDAEMDYIWRGRFFNNRGGASDWSADAAFTTDFADCDLDGNGVSDHQEADVMLDLDQDGFMDRDQDDIKCVDTGNDQIGLSVRNAHNLDSLISMEIEDPDDEILAPQGNGEPAAVQFGLLSFKLRVKAPGDETTVTIYLSEADKAVSKHGMNKMLSTCWFEIYADDFCERQSTTVDA